MKLSKILNYSEFWEDTLTISTAIETAHKMSEQVKILLSSNTSRGVSDWELDTNNLALRRAIATFGRLISLDHIEMNEL